MFAKAALVALVSAAAVTQVLAVAMPQTTSTPWGMCGGEGWEGGTLCPDGYYCNYLSPYYSGCYIDAQPFHQCGGTDWTAFDDPKVCTDGYVCQWQTDELSLCLVAPYAQCAGDGWSGPPGTCSTSSYVCFEIDSHDSRCLPIPVVQPSEQCAGPGFDWEGPDGVCTDGYTCQYVYDDASFCVPVGGY